MKTEKYAKHFSCMNRSFKNHLGQYGFYLILSLYFVFLILQMHHFTWSDQYLYRLYYNGLEQLTLSEGFGLYVKTIGAREPVYFFLTFILQHVVERQVFEILLSFTLWGVLIFYFHKTKTPKSVIVFIVTGIYFLSVFFITERLKLGMIFLLLYFIFYKQRFGLIYIFLALLTHAQLLLLLPFLYFFTGFKINSKKTLGLLLLISTVVVIFLYPHLSHKLPIYFERFSYLNIIKPLIFGLITFFLVSKNNWKEFFSYFIPVIVVALFFGDGRMTSFAFLGSIYFWSIEKKISFRAVPLFLACSYFSLRGVVLILSAVIYGDGYGIIGVSDLLKMIK